LLLVARLDNLGKGAAGAAVQNLNLMLGLPELAGVPMRPDATAGAAR
jgi:N-acetyl-gamma-glutamyl-phosphate reductase